MIKILTNILSVRNNTQFKLNTKKIYIYKYLLPFIIFISAVVLFFNNAPLSKPSGIDIGDSHLTSIIVKKDIEKNITVKSISSRAELQKIASKAPLGFAFYRVLPGENLSSVASKFGLSMATVLSMNSFLDDILCVGSVTNSSLLQNVFLLLCATCPSCVHSFVHVTYKGIHS